MKALKVKAEDLVRVVPEGLGDLDHGVRDVAKMLTFQVNTTPCKAGL
jgi:hypothetical protein